jgi:hypothetical protein
MTAPEPTPGMRKATEEELRSTEKLMDRMFADPAISCSFKFSWTGDEEQANKAVTLLRAHAQLHKERHPWMSFANLKEMSFHVDYEQGLRDAVEPGSKHPEPTKEAGGLSVGMLLKSANGSKLVLHEGVAHALLSGKQEFNDFALSVIFHELCHVHDDSFKSSLLTRDNIVVARNAMENRFLAMAEAMWAEYFANKYSHGPWSDVRSDFVLLKDAVRCVRADIRAAILTYRTSHQLDSLLAIAEQKVRFLAQCFGYALGRFAGLGKTLEEHDAEMASVLANSGMTDAWRSAFETLEGMDARRPGWHTYWVVAELVPICRSLMVSCGLVYRPKGDGLYVDVPFTSETTPLFAGMANMEQVFRSLESGVARMMRNIVTSSGTQPPSDGTVDKDGL